MSEAVHDLKGTQRKKICVGCCMRRELEMGAWGAKRHEREPNRLECGKQNSETLISKRSRVSLSSEMNVTIIF